MKRITAFVCSAVLLLTSLFCADFFALAEQEESIEKTQLGSSSTYYEYDLSTKTLTISGSGSTPTFTNSSSGSDAQPWFSWRSDGSVEKIVVEEGVTALGSYCFYGVTADDISLPSTLTRIGSYAFAGNSSLETIDLVNVVTISNNAFYNCTSLCQITIPSTVTSIGSSAFEGCSSLSNVEFSSMKAEITLSSKAFLNCSSLKSMDVPRYATLGSYSVGFQKASSGSIYEDFTMGVFRDSKAYTYATKYYISYELLDSMVIEEGDEIDGTYYDDSLDEEISYYFTPTVDCQYVFSSSGDVDLDCVLKNSDGEVIDSASDNSEDDLNFTLSAYLTAGETYIYTVSSVYSTGSYTLSLMPAGCEGVSISWDISLSAADVSDGILNIAECISGMSVDFSFESGYVYHMPFEEGASYLGMDLHYAGTLCDSVTCGDNTDYITVGDETLEFVIYVEHCYESVTVEPTLTNGGYTRYTCLLCGNAYTTDFVSHLGTDVYGYVRVLELPNGDAIENSFIPYCDIYNNEGEYVGQSDENGFFYIEYAYEYLTFVSPAGVERTVEIEQGVNELGDIALVYCDYNVDGYINAKDFALLVNEYGEYDESDATTKSFDVNANGEIDYGDWEYALNFVTYGKLTESVYSN